MIELYVLRQSNDIFKDILTPFSARQNERYFYKSFGVPSNENEYFNNIYNLDRNESLKEKVYCKFINSIPLQNTTDIFTKVKDSFKFKDLTQKDFVFQKCFEFCNLTGIPEEMQKEMKVAFVNVCNHWFQYTQKNKKVTFDMLINFGVKMTAWVNSTIPQIICGLVNKTDNGKNNNGINSNSSASNNNNVPNRIPQLGVNEYLSITIAIVFMIAGILFIKIKVLDRRINKEKQKLLDDDKNN